MAARASPPTAQRIPALAAEFERRMAGELPARLRARRRRRVGRRSRQSRETRRHAQGLADRCSTLLAPSVPELLGGSADLTGSNLTDFTGCGAVRGGAKGGRHINYGVREFGMAAIMNGIALHGGFIPYGGTFLTFSDYSRNAIRMAALMKLRVIHVFTHDSHRPGRRRPDAPAGRARGEPAPDPEPGRLAPVRRRRDRGGLDRRRSAQRDRPSALLLSRQNLPAQPRSAEQVLDDPPRRLRAERTRRRAVAVILATGSEVALAMAAQQLLDARGIAGARGVAAVDDRLRPPGPRPTATPCSAAACRASASRPA